jgi:hypothetical protein
MRVIYDLCGGTGAWSKPYGKGYDVRVIDVFNGEDVMKYITKEAGFDGYKHTAYYSPDGGYIGTKEDFEHLDKMGIQPELAEKGGNVCSIRFCEQEQKWYGWSHRAMGGFGVGSEVKKGDCGYIADTPEGLIESRIEFFSDLGEEKAQTAKDECQILPDRSGIRVLHAPLIIPMANNIEDALEGVVSGVIDLHEDAVSIIKCGKGEWVANTLEDAKQMAIDFADGVS